MAKQIYSLQGRDWNCEFNPATGYWTAQSTEPHSVVVEPDWDALKESIRNFDPASPRVDAVAVCDPLPPMGAKAFGQGALPPKVADGVRLGLDVKDQCEGLFSIDGSLVRCPEWATKWGELNNFLGGTVALKLCDRCFAEKKQ